MSLIDRIDSICLQVNNIEQASYWYQEVLGFKEIFRGTDYLILGVGSSEIPLILEKDLGKEVRSINQVYPIFFTRNIEKTYEKLQRDNVKTSTILDNGISKSLDVYDLDHNRLKVCHWE
ncbi:VOC family protein [Oceanobacillus senegalensis]|uniref:VOC family protein n=1 Tax=Oceanobacillus senegalensis TaxID=1936063 RepID=UPI000A310BC0|nr:VOC family protein [Oceanobacillus senegalensis]